MPKTDVDVSKDGMMMKNGNDVSGISGQADLKEFSAKISEIKQKLREMEDLDLITKLETVQTQDEILVLQDDFSMLSKKVDLLSDALKILSAKTANVSKTEGVGLPRQANFMEADFSSLKKDIDDVRLKMGSYTESQAMLKGLQAKYDDVESRLQGLVATMNSKLDSIKNEPAKPVNVAPAPMAAAVDADSGAIKAEMSKMEKEIESIQALVNGISSGFAESKASFKAIMDKAAASEAMNVKISSDYKGLRNDLLALQAKIVDVEAHIGSFAAYDDVAKLGAEIEGLKSSISAKALVHEAPVVHETGDISALKGEVEEISGSFRKLEDNISKRIEKIESDLGGFTGEKNRLDSDMAGIKVLSSAIGKKVDMLEGKVSAYADKKNSKDSGVSLRVDKLEQEFGGFSGKADKIDAEMTGIKADSIALGRRIDNLDHAVSVLSSDAKLKGADVSKQMDKRVAKIEADVGGIGSKADKFGAAVAGVKAESVALGKRVDAIDCAVSELSSLSSLPSEVKNANAANADVLKRVGMIEKDVGGLNSENGKIHADIADVRAGSAALGKRVDAIDHAVSGLSSEFKDADASVSKRVEKLEHDVSGLNSDKAKIHAIHADIADVRAGSAALGKRVDAIDNAVSGLSGLSSEVKNANVANADMSKRIGMIEKDVGGFAGKTDKIAADFAKLKTDSAGLAKTLSDVDSRMSLEDKKLKGGLEAVRYDFSEFKKKYDGGADVSSELKDISEKVGSLESRVDKDVSLLKGQISEMVVAKGLAAGEGASNPQAVKKMIEEIRSFRKDVADVTEKTRGFDAKFKDYRQKFSGDVLSIKGTVDSLDRKMDEDVGSLKIEVEGIKNAHDMLNDGITALEDQFKNENESMIKEIENIRATVTGMPKVDEALEGRLKKIEDGITDYTELKAKLLDYLKRQMNDKSKDSLKYVPVIKDNVSKLYNAYTGTEKRLTNVEKMVSGINISELEKTLNVLSTDVRKEMKAHKDDHAVFADKLRKDYDAQLLGLKAEVAAVLESVKNANYMSLDEFDEFRAKVLDSVDELRGDFNAISLKNNGLHDSIKKDYNSEMLALKAEFAKLLVDARGSANKDHKELSDFKAKVVADLEKLHVGVDAVKDSMKAEDIEKIVGESLGELKVDIDKQAKAQAELQKALESRVNAEFDKALKSQAEVQKALESKVELEIGKTVKSQAEMQKALESKVELEIGKVRTSQSDLETAIGEKLKKDYEAKIASLNENIMQMLEQKRKSNDMNYEEFAEFRAKVLDDIDRLSEGVGALGNNISGEFIGKAIDMKLDKRSAVIYDRLNKIDGKFASLSVPNIEKDIENRVKTAIDNELADVVSNIDSISKDMKSEISKRNSLNEKAFEKIKKDYRSELIALKSEFANVLASKRHSNDMNYEEFAEFRAQVLNDVDDLKDGFKSLGRVLTPGDVENIVDNRVMQNSRNIDMLANSIKLLDRKIEQKHLEVSKNSHNKINDSVKSFDDRIAALEGDIDMLKDMKGDLVNDVNEVIDHMKGGADGSRFVTESEIKDYDSKVRGLEEKLKSMLEKSHSADVLMEKGMNSKISELENKIKMLEEKAMLNEKLESQLVSVQDRNKSLNTEIENSLHTKFSEFENKLQTLESGVASRDYLERRVAMLQNESDILRAELDKMRALYFEMAEREEEAPVVIE